METLLTSDNMANIIITTINTILENLFSSIDNTLYSVLDDITFISPDILNTSYFQKILGMSASSGILIIANSLLLGYLIYFSIKYLLAHFYSLDIEAPHQFIFKLLFFRYSNELFLFYFRTNFKYFLEHYFINSKLGRKYF